MKLDTVISWPRHIDYPLFREYIHENRKKFNKIIIVFTDMNVADIDYRNHIQQAMKQDKIIFIDCLPAKAHEDWRNKAVNMGLSVSSGDWVFFWEQDFTPLEGFWREAQDLSRRADVFGIFQEGRLHPCCIFIKKELLNKTSKDFGAYPEAGHDHFGKLQQQIENKAEMIGVIFPKYGKHLNGLSQNIHMLQNGEMPNYNPDEFKQYVEDCLKSKMKMPLALEELFKQYADTV